MDTQRFELTPEERSQVIQRDTTLWCPTKGEFLDEVGKVIAKAQVEKVLALLEPPQKAKSLTRDESGKWWITFSDGVKVSLNDSHQWVAEQVHSRFEPELTLSKTPVGEIIRCLGNSVARGPYELMELEKLIAYARRDQLARDQQTIRGNDGHKEI